MRKPGVTAARAYGRRVRTHHHPLFDGVFGFGHTGANARHMSDSPPVGGLLGAIFFTLRAWMWLLWTVKCIACIIACWWLTTHGMLAFAAMLFTGFTLLMGLAGVVGGLRGIRSMLWLTGRRVAIGWFALTVIVALF